MNMLLLLTPMAACTVARVTIPSDTENSESIVTHIASTNREGSAIRMSRERLPVRITAWQAESLNGTGLLIRGGAVLFVLLSMLVLCCLYANIFWEDIYFARLGYLRQALRE